MNNRPVVPRSVHDLARALKQRIAEDEARRRGGEDVKTWAHAKVRWVVGSAVLMRSEAQR